MSEPTIKIAMRVPGPWRHPTELIERLPEGCRLTPESLFLADGTEIEFGAAPADDQFASIFKSSCREVPTDEELATVENYSVNVFLSGPGGSLDSARTMMRAAATIIDAGGAGVFIDNCTLAHGGQHWLAITEDGGPDALTFAFAAIIGGKTEVWTMGMHVLGLRDVVMKRADADSDEFGIIEVIRYLAAAEKPVENGHWLADPDGPRFRAFAQDSPPEYRGPMHNPFGRLKLVSLKDIGESN
jgi:hypothetical protein